MNERVLVVTPSMKNPGGVAHYYRALRDHLGSDVEYFTRGGAGHETTLSGAVRLVADIRKFQRRLREHDISVVHLNPSFGYKSLLRDRFFLSSAKRLELPVILFFRGWDRRCERVVRRYLLSWFRSKFFVADHIIVLSHQFERALREMGFEGPITVETTVAPDFVFERGDTPRDDSSSARDSTVEVLFLSRLERDKGIYEAIETHRKLLQRHPNVRLTIAGSGPELAAVKEHLGSERVPHVRLLGYVDGDDKEQAFRRADIYFFPSHYGEGMPNSVLEAMAYGLPVVARPVGGLADFFENESMGYATSETDPGTFAELIALLVADHEKRKKMGRFNRAYAEEHFRASKAADRLLRIYRCTSRAGAKAR